MTHFVSIHRALAHLVNRKPSEPLEETSIYAIYDPRDNGVRYVGQTKKSLAARLAAHLEDPTNIAMAYWFSTLRAAGTKPAIELLEICPDRRWQLAERFWIRWFRIRGELLNVDPGGVCRDQDGKLLKGIRQDRLRLSPKDRKRIDVAKFITSGAVKVFSREDIAATYGADKVGKPLDPIELPRKTVWDMSPLQEKLARIRRDKGRNSFMK